MGEYLLWRAVFLREAVKHLQNLEARRTEFEIELEAIHLYASLSLGFLSLLRLSVLSLLDLVLVLGHRRWAFQTEGEKKLTL